MLFLRYEFHNILNCAIQRRQILIYPALGNCYTEESPYRSVHENGSDYLLTAVKMEDYMNLYQRSEEDRQNPYFAPILEKNLRNLPETLILTAEYDPLRDEGEAYGSKLQDAGNYVDLYRKRYSKADKRSESESGDK